TSFPDTWVIAWERSLLAPRADSFPGQRPSCSGRWHAVRARDGTGKVMSVTRIFSAETGGKAMRNLLAFVAAVGITLHRVGGCLDGYQIKSAPAPAGHNNVNIDFNRVKIADDVHKGVQKGEEKLHDVLDKKPKPEEKDKPVVIPGIPMPNP